MATPAPLHDLLRTQSARWVYQHQATLIFQEDASEADLLIFPIAQLVARADQLQPVPEELLQRGGRYDWNGLLPLYRERFTRVEATPHALPLIGEAPIAVYRRDFYASTENQNAYARWRSANNRPEMPLRPPLTWREWTEQALFFHEHLKKPSLAALPETPEGRERLFHLLAACHARRAIREDEPEGADHEAEVFYFHYRPGTHEPRLATPGFVYALELLRQMQPARSSEADYLRRGEPALAVIEAGELTHWQQQPTTRDRYAVFALPGADRFWNSADKLFTPESRNLVPFHGGAGWLIGVSRSCTQNQAAWDLVAELTGPRRSAEIASEPRSGAGPIRLEQLVRDRWDSLDVDTVTAQTLKDLIGRHLLQHGLKNPVSILRLPDRPARLAALDQALLDALQGKQTPLAALQKAAETWKQLDEAIGKDKAQQIYRRSLGLID
ncbi:MAG: hypothetical protein SNJ75_07935 [Gemmataceae bacterium]